MAVTRREWVGTLQVPTHSLSYVHDVCGDLKLGTQVQPEPDRFYQEVAVYGERYRAAKLAGHLRKQSIPFHLQMDVEGTVYGEFVSLDRYQATHLPFHGIDRPLDWDNQEHIHKQQKVLALLNS